MTVHLAITGRSHELSCTWDKLHCYSTVFEVAGGLDVADIYFALLLGLEHAVNLRHYFRLASEHILPLKQLLAYEKKLYLLTCDCT